jgi:hypothetical protein
MERSPRFEPQDEEFDEVSTDPSIVNFDDEGDFTEEENQLEDGIFEQEEPDDEEITTMLQTGIKLKDDANITTKDDTDSSSARSFLLVIFIMTLFMLLKLLMKPEFIRSEAYERNAMFFLIKDICFMVSIMLVVLIIHYYEGLKSFNTSVDNVLYGMFFFIICWMVFGFLVMKNSFLHIKKFKHFEKFSCDASKLNELKRVYENQYYTRNGKTDNELKERISYLFMKQGFINPVELPTVTESFLRRDFNLALYFGYSLSEFISELFSFGYQAYIIIFVTVLSFQLFSYAGVLLQSIFMILFPVTSLIGLLIQYKEYKVIYNKLVPPVKEPENISFSIDVDIRDPFDQYDKIQFPPYLEPKERYESPGASDKEEEAEEEKSSVRHRERSSKSQRSSDFSHEDEFNDSIVLEDEQNGKTKKEEMFRSSQTLFSYRQNRHERLFWLGKVGIYLEKIWLQSFFIQMILWISHLLEYKYLIREGIDDYYITNIAIVDYFIMIGALILGLYTLLIVFPKICFKYMVITSIQMMKKRHVIEETIKEQRSERSMRSFRMFQVFKLIRRELIQFFNQDISDKSLRPFTKQLIEENYTLFQSNDKESINLANISEFIPLCGVEMKQLENFLLMKKAKSDGESISFKDLLQAIEQTTNDVKVDPFDVVKTIFTLVMKNKKQLTIEDIKQFFDVYDGYFEREDVQDFLNELVAIQRDGTHIDVQEIASLIRDDIECFPR